MIPDRFGPLVLVVIGLLIGAVLCFCGVVPWWAVPLVALGVAAAVVGVSGLLFVALWMSSGGR